MKTIGIFAILIPISISNEIKSAETELLDAPAFIDNDFTDYQEDPSLKIKRETHLDKNLAALTDLESAIKLGNSNPEKAILLLKITRGNSSNNAPTSLVDIQSKLEKNPEQKPGEEKANLRAKREATFSTKSASIEKEDVETIFRRVEKLSPEEEKSLLIANREAIFSDNAYLLPEDDDEPIFIRNGKPLLKKEIAAKKFAAALEIKHDNDMKVQEIMNFMQHNYMTTNYVYDEVQRIKKQGQVRDKFRSLIHYLEQKNNEKLKEFVLNCYQARIKIDTQSIDVWNHRLPNNLLINTLKDPQNHGNIN